MVENTSTRRIHGRESIRREWTAPYNLKQNGVAERKNRTIVEAARAMLYDQDMPKFLWAEACNMAVYVQNRTPHRALGKIIQEGVFTGKKPKVSRLKLFGSLAYCHVREEKRKKLDQTVKKGYLVGYSENAKAYRVYLLGNKKIVIQQDVKFTEDKAFRKSREMPSEEQSKDALLVQPLHPIETSKSISPKGKTPEVSQQVESQEEEEQINIPTTSGRTSREL